MNFYSLKIQFREYLIEQGYFSSLSNNEEDLDSISLFTYDEEFKDFVYEQYNIDLEDGFSDLSELYDAEIQDGQFILSEENIDEETNFMVDIVNNLIQDEEFVESIDDYAANDNQEDSMLVMLNNLLKEKGLLKDDEILDVQNTPEIPSDTSTNPTSNNGKTNNNFNKNINTDGNKNYSTMDADELENEYNSQQNEINTQSENINNTVNQNKENVAEAKEEYDTALSKDNIEPQLLESRNQNLDAITQTDNTINELNATIAAVDAQIFSLDSQISVVNGKISALEAALASLSNAPKNDENIQLDVENKRAQIASELKTQNDELTRLTNEKTKLENQQKLNQENLTKNTSALQTLEMEKTQIDNQILQTCNEQTKKALENYNKARSDSIASLQNAKNSLEEAKKELTTIETYLNAANAKEIEKTYGYSEKSDAFKENEGYILEDGDNSTDMSYSVITPNNIDKDKEAPLMIYLHGGGGSERSLYNQIMNDYGLEEGFNGYIVCPTLNRSSWDKDGVAEDIEQILDTFSKNHKIDPENIVVVGHSLGGTGALHLADSDVFKNNSRYKLSKAAALTGYPTTQKDYDIPIALWADSTSEYALKNHLLNPDSKDDYVDLVGQSHKQIDNIAFTLDRDNDGKADLIEWLFDEN